MLYKTELYSTNLRLKMSYSPGHLKSLVLPVFENVINKALRIKRDKKLMENHELYIK